MSCTNAQSLMVRAFLPSEAAATVIVVAGTVFLVSTNFGAMMLAAWIFDSVAAPDRGLLEPLLLMLSWLIGPVLLAGVMFRLPEKEGLWKTGLWAMAVFFGWYLFPGWILVWLFMPPRPGLAALLPFILISLIGLMVIYASVALTRSPKKDEGPSAS